MTEILTQFCHSPVGPRATWARRCVSPAFDPADNLEFLLVKSLLKWSALMALLLLRAVAEGSPVRHDPLPLNVIIIIADDMALGDIGLFNEHRSRTPHLDRLVRSSVWFERGYSASPVCAPARAALRTGRYPHRTGVVSLSQLTELEQTRLMTDETTLADVFGNAGYRTGLVGKWHNGLGFEWHPLRRGFDEFWGFTTQLDSYFDFDLELNGELGRYEGSYLTDVLSALAIDFVRRHAQDAFLLELAHYAPHRPLGAPPALVDYYVSQGFDKNTANIYAMVEVMDQGIGQLMDELDLLGIRNRTVVVFVSDNGPDPLVGERYNLGLRGGKYEIYEGGIRVPFLISLPGQLSPRTEPTPVHFIDLLPTLVALCGIALPAELELDGVNLEELLRRRVPLSERPLFWQWNRGDPNYTHNAAVLLGEWKLVRPFVTYSVRSPEDSMAAPELYNIYSPHSPESINVAAAHRDHYDALLRQLDRWSEEVETDRNRPALQRSRTPLMVYGGLAQENGSAVDGCSLVPGRCRGGEVFYQIDAEFALFSPALGLTSSPRVIPPFRP
jgi:arylsulfatase A-like enzyme